MLRALRDGLGSVHLAVDAVRLEPVSHRVCLNREKYREFCRNRRSAPISAPNQRVNSIASSRIPYATEQGISKAVSLGQQGILHPIAWTKPHADTVDGSALAHSRALVVASENSDWCVSMVYPAKNRLRNNVSEPLIRACAGCVLAKRKVRPHLKQGSPARLAQARVSARKRTKRACTS
jgi:hypothetical protein